MPWTATLRTRAEISRTSGCAELSAGCRGRGRARWPARGPASVTPAIPVRRVRPPRAGTLQPPAIAGDARRGVPARRTGSGAAQAVEGHRRRQRPDHAQDGARRFARHDVPADEVYAKGMASRCAKGLDWISGPEGEVPARHRDRLVRRPAFRHRGESSHGGGEEIRFARPNTCTRRPTRNYTSRIAQQRLVPARGRDRGRQAAQVGTRTTRVSYFLDVPVMYAVARVPRSVNERKSGF